MNLSFVFTLFLAFNLTTLEIDLKDLIGKWQLVYFEGMDKIKASQEYKSADSAMRINIDYKIKLRLENTVYDFVSVDSLWYADLEKGALVMKKAKIHLKEPEILVISDGKQIREARILEVEANKLVLEPISTNSSGGKMIFERIVKEEK